VTVRTVALAALALAGAGLAGGAHAAPRVVADQLGTVRQVVVGDRHIAWTRCLSPLGPTEVWTAPLRSGRPRRVPGIRVPGECEPVRIVGLHGDRVVTLIRGNSLLQRLDAVHVRTGQRVPLEAEGQAASGVRITGADSEGPRVVWLREAGAGDGRQTETVLADLRSPRAGLFSGAARRVVATRSVRFAAVVPNGAWIAGDGRPVVRERLQGAQYGYGLGEERAVLLGADRTVQYARTRDGAVVAAGDLTTRVFAYTVADATSGQARVFLRDRRTGSRRLLRRLVRLPAPVPRAVPAIPAPSAHGRWVVWRERLPVRGGFVDRVLAHDVLRGRTRGVVNVRDSRGQRSFVSPPSVRSGRVAWAEVTLATAAGPRGGYYGVAPPGSRSRVLIAPVR
jgi:hypothetical protein